MLPKVLLALLNIFMILQARLGGHLTTLNNKTSARGDDFVYGPQPKPQPKKLLSEETALNVSKTGRTGSKLPEASRILNTILSHYDHKLRPGIGEKPTVVTVEVSVNSLGPLSILDMEYTIDIIFYQTWYDERLRFNDTFESLVLNGNVVSQLWIPDTFFRNSKRTQEHELTMPNQMVRIHKDGKVLYTIRMTIDAGCSLHMLKFPMDSHSCPLSFSSFSYTVSEMIYQWDNFKLEINEKNSWKLFQFDFTGLSNKTEIISTPAGEFMVMTFFFNVSRRFGYVAFQNYVPSSVTTMLSWVSFWIKKESAPARASLGITSVLTMTTLGTFSRKHFPRVSYITALDFYIAICFVFCFCALLEFAVLNFLTYNRTKAHASPKLRHPPIGGRAHARTRARAVLAPRARARQQQEVFVCEIITSEGSDGEEVLSCSVQRAPSPGSPQGSRSPHSRVACYECCKGFKKYFCMMPDCEGSTWQRGRLCIHVYRLDNYSRVVFPVTFFFFNVVYWLVCLNL
ncbi:LOW QUALITY PROTEIN: gamma-aminobutyric acid receptor subunit epsilon [Dipodomys spectabilis]|uniref:LOW QUALITY PROTEIN: gamma-aminobutyric acid receptor subunit epsilon n=1 Tax=Dipodomys spectabilis TaxID=105255 RepID=UPI001C53CCCA|nr:LOW QUALITY PROTEIN: gamma-aminobutyric acid receptor subunit epsilon [Dipodomys spectabilis]